MGNKAEQCPDHILGSALSDWVCDLTEKHQVVNYFASD